MQIIRKRACARAGLIGNPSDGYGGKTISISVRDHGAEVVLYEWEDVEVVLAQDDRVRFSSIADLVRDVRLHGYYGGIRLVKATIKTFADYCRRTGRELHERNFSVRYTSDVPRQVGMAGSSAIIVATLRCLMEFYDLRVPLEVQPSLALAVERDELGIGAGLQDRVIQVYEGVVAMDFDPARATERDGFATGVYEPLDAAALPPVYLAYSVDAGEPTEVFHNNLRQRYDAGDAEVRAAMARFAALVDEFRVALAAGDAARMSALIDENFDLRASLCRLPPAQAAMVEAARAAGASAKFAGSGGAIIGLFDGDAMFERLAGNLQPLGCKLLRPRIDGGP